MKTLLFLFTLTVSITNLQATDKYTAAMQKNIESIYQAETLEDYQTTVNSFERIAQGEKTKWEPYYYASFGYIMMSMNSQDNTQKDSYLDLAVKSLDQAKKLKPEDSEITALEGFIVMMRVAADPASRGAQLSGLSMQLFGKALALDPNNPRALALLAQMQYGSAQFFKAPITEACATVAKAVENFETFTSENPLAPTWGKGMALSLQAQCK